MKKPVISVIMPAFKNEDTIRRAIDSFLGQDVSVPCELVIGIDDSGDGTLEIVKEYSSKYPSVRLHIEEKRMGQAMSRYKAILDSEGEYVYFMDADDELRKDCLSTFLKVIKETDADCVNASFYQVDDRKTSRFLFAKDSELNKKEALSAFFKDTSFRGFLWTKMWKRKVFENRPLLLLSETKDMFEDVAFCLSLLLYCEKVVTIKEPLYYYYKNVPTSAMSVKRTDRAMRHLWVFALARCFLEKKGDKELIRAFEKSRFRSRLSLSFDLLLDKKYGASKEYMKKVKEEWKAVANTKTALSLEDGSYVDIIKRAWLH